MFTSHYAYTSEKGRRRHVDAFNGKHTFTLTEWMFEGKPQFKLTQRVYKNGCPHDRSVPSRGSHATRHNEMVSALQALLNG